MTIIVVDQSELEQYLADRFGDKLQTGNRKKNVADSYRWDKKGRFLHDNKGAKGVSI